jgi:hypothetical protein
MHVGYVGTIDNVLLKYDLEGLLIRSKYDVFHVLVGDETSALDIIRKSGFTVEIESQDLVREKIYRGFSRAIMSAVNHYEKDKRDAADKITIVFKNYGNITTRTLDEETAAIEDLLRELRTDENTILLTTLGLTGWVNELEKENVKFNELMLARYKEVSQRTTLRMIDVRKSVDKALRDLFEQIEALVRVNGMEAYDSLIKEINAVNERYKNILAQQAGERKAKYDDLS